MYFFKFKSKDYFDAYELPYVTEHKQVRDELKIEGKSHYANLLGQLHKLRKKADYYLDENLTKIDVDKSIYLMDEIIKNLSFD